MSQLKPNKTKQKSTRSKVSRPKIRFDIELDSEYESSLTDDDLIKLDRKLRTGLKSVILPAQSCLDKCDVGIGAIKKLGAAVGVSLSCTRKCVTRIVDGKIMKVCEFSCNDGKGATVKGTIS